MIVVFLASGGSTADDCCVPGQWWEHCRRLLCSWPVVGALQTIVVKYVVCWRQFVGVKLVSHLYSCWDAVIMGLSQWQGRFL